MQKKYFHVTRIVILVLILLVSISNTSKGSDSELSFEWVKTWGSENYDIGRSVATDNNGNIFVTGKFTDTVDFGDGNPISEKGSSKKSCNAYLCKFDSNGNLIWVETWNGSISSSVYSVAADANGNAYVTGYYLDPVHLLSKNSRSFYRRYDIFLRKFDSDGNLEWEKIWGGIVDHIGYSVTTDNMENVIITGVFKNSVDFGDNNQISSNGGRDIFLCKFNPDGQLKWVKTWGGEKGDSGTSVTSDNDNNIYITGTFMDSVDFGDGNSIRSNGERDIFLSKFDSSGKFKWVKTWGGSDEDSVGEVHFDGKESIYVTGSFYDTVDFGDGNPISVNGSANSSKDAYLCKFDSNSNFKWVKTWGGASRKGWGGDSGSSIATNGYESIFVTGHFSGIPAAVKGKRISSKGLTDVFLCKFDSNGNFILVETWGSASRDRGYSVVSDGQGNIYVTGAVKGSVDFGDGNWTVSKRGYDAFLVKFSSE